MHSVVHLGIPEKFVGLLDRPNHGENISAFSKWETVRMKCQVIFSVEWMHNSCMWLSDQDGTLGKLYQMIPWMMILYLASSHELLSGSLQPPEGAGCLQLWVRHQQGAEQISSVWLRVLGSFFYSTPQLLGQNPPDAAVNQGCEVEYKWEGNREEAAS